MKEQRESGSFMSGVLVLSLSTVIVKVIGLAYKIPMLSYLGTEGMGYFNSAYEIYAMLCVISTAGLPVALSMLISAGRQREDWDEIRRIRRSAMTLFLFLGALGSTCMVLFSRSIAEWIGNTDARFCIVAIAPALFFVCISSAFRGWFQGFNQMLPTAVSQLIEALGKLGFGIWFASWALKQGWGIPMVSAAAIMGISLGTVLSVIYLSAVRWLGGRKNAPVLSSPIVQSKKRESSMLLLIRIAIPITLSSAVLSITKLSDMALIMRRLQFIGMNVAEANRIYGAYTTLAVPVFSLIPALITPISLSLVPQLSAAIEGKSREKQQSVVERALKMTVLLSMPAGMGICVYSTPILSLLFPAKEEAISLAAPLLSVLGLSILFSGMITTTNAMLQSYRQETKPIVSMTVGAGIKILLAYLLIGNPSVGVMGAPISTFGCNVTVTVLNLLFLKKCFPSRKIPGGMLSIYYKPLLASVISISISLLGYIPVFRHTNHGSLAFIIACGLAVVSYLVLGVAMGMITKEDFSFLPVGKRILKAKHNAKS
ncbi:MAG: polysaccharide biosynthesis protein [Clostridia bacterium]|nr:polysaccharide biosynthesis protein [Clostridia bacterium]